ncbi:hypothetical protein GCM10022234_30390 [Aeromicrobium panaciterrae]|uniref:DUF6318 family protein n=1 Tax=Aeromicrobium panaciterrae TaxID=363861 RepID=UPI0031D19FA5
MTAPTMPAQAKENTPEGAAAFVDHYIQVLNYASKTGDVTELSHLSDSSCSGCQKYIKLYRDTYAEGGSFSGGEWSPGEMKLDFGEPETYVTTTVAISESKYTDSHGVSSIEPASSARVSFGIAGDPWVVTQAGLGEPK